jgi:hypothetical protein
MIFLMLKKQLWKFTVSSLNFLFSLVFLLRLIDKRIILPCWREYETRHFSAGFNGASCKVSAIV